MADANAERHPLSDAEERPVADDIAFQARVWKAERIGWCVMTIVVGSGLLGVFSNGPLSNRFVASSDGVVRVEYERFGRKTAVSHFTMTVASSSGPEVQLRLGPDFARFYDIESLQPIPRRTTAGADGLELVFATASKGDLSVRLAARADHFGIARINIEVEGKSIALKQFIYP